MAEGVVGSSSKGMKPGCVGDGSYGGSDSFMNECVESLRLFQATQDTASASAPKEKPDDKVRLLCSCLCEPVCVFVCVSFACAVSVRVCACVRVYACT